MEAEARRIGRKAEHEGDLRCAIASIKQVVEIVELMARLLDAFPKADGKDAHPPTRIVYLGIDPSKLGPPVESKTIEVNRGKKRGPSVSS
jgi:hypothetical protein